MILEDVSKLSGSMKGILAVNPIAMKLKDSKNLLADRNESVIYFDTEIKKREAQIIEYRLSMIQRIQQVKISEKEVGMLTKLLESSHVEFDFSMIEKANMEKFFNSMGLRFVDMVFRRYEDSAFVRYIRPTRLISNIPVQPMVVEIHYTRKDNALQFRRVQCRWALSSSSHVHPHISSNSGYGDVCLGNFTDKLLDNNVGASMECYQDHVILLEELLATYNSDSPYKALDEILGDTISRGITFEIGRNLALDNNEWEVVTNFSYPHATIPTFILIGEQLFKDYFASLEKLTLLGIAQDVSDRISCLESGDDPVEDLEFMDSYHSKLMKLFQNKISFASTYDYSEMDTNDDGDDYTYLSESGFDDLKELWCDSISDFLLEHKDYPIKIEIPNVEEIFQCI